MPKVSPLSAPKKLALLTSGGDCPGLNAVIRAVVTYATRHYGWQVWGIEEGLHGLLQTPEKIRLLMPNQLEPDLFRKGGTMLGTSSKGYPFAPPSAEGEQDASAATIARFHQLGFNLLLGVGGDGSLAILKRLADKGGIPLIGIPKTIDNDVSGTDSAIGFATAVAIATEALDRLQPTAASHNRVMVLEVMGRDAGHIALHAGIAGGADVILVPEIPYSLHAIERHIQRIRAQGRNFALVVVSEAVRTEGGMVLSKRQPSGQKRLGGIGHYIGERIAERSDAEVRVNVLGHVQRGAPPNAQDRLLASAMGIHGVDLLARGESDKMVCWRGQKPGAIAIAEAITPYRSIAADDPMLTTARALGICLGDEG